MIPPNRFNYASVEAKKQSQENEPTYFAYFDNCPSMRGKGVVGNMALAFSTEALEHFRNKNYLQINEQSFNNYLQERKVPILFLGKEGALADKVLKSQ